MVRPRLLLSTALPALALLGLFPRAEAAPPIPLPPPATALPGPDPRPGPPLEKLSLGQALERALARNVNAVVAAAEARRAQAVVEQVRASALPTLIAGATYTRLDDDRRLGDQVFVPANQLNANLTLTVPLLAPQRWAQWAHALNDRESARADAVATRRQVGVSTAQAYLATLAAQRVIESNERARDVALVHYSFAYKRLAGGVGSELDAVRALQTLREDSSRVSAARATLLQAQGALGTLLGLDQPVDVSEAPDFRMELDPTQSLAELPKRRADLVALSIRLDAARRVYRDRWTDYLPSLFGVFMPTYQSPASLIQPAYAWQAQLQLSLPIYDGGLRYGQAHVRAAQLDQASAQLDGALSQGRTGLQVGFAALRHDERALADAKQAAELAQRAVDIAELSYRHGATTNLELLDAQRRARDASTAAVIAEDEVRRVRLDLLAATGRFP